MDPNNVSAALEMMWKGMAGIFTVNIILSLIVFAMSKMKRKENKEA